MPSVFLKTIDVLDALSKVVLYGPLDDLIAEVEKEASPIVSKEDVDLFLTFLKKIRDLKPLIVEMSEKGKKLDATINASPKN